MTREEKAKRRQDVIEYVRSGHTKQETAERYGITAAYVGMICPSASRRKREDIAKQHEEMKAYKAEGHTAKEVADKFGTSADYARAVCAGVAPQGYGPGHMKPQEEVGAFIEERVPGCEYAGNYTGADGRADLRCKKCGTLFNRSMISVRKGACSCPTCRKMKQNKLREQREEDRRNKEKEKEEKRIRKEERRRELEAERERNRALRYHPCPVCGTMTTNQKYCSSKCRNKANNSAKDARRRKKIADAMVDKDITVMGLFRRDAGVCYICGGRCNAEDFTVIDGTFIAGDWYPSIDHVVPLAKGGLHSWDNVRLAHRRCNSIKSDKTETI